MYPIGNMRSWFEYLATSSTFPLAWEHNTHHSWEDWRDAARRKVHPLLHYDPPQVPLNIDIVESVDRGPFMRHKIYFDSAPHVRVPAYLLVPKGARKAPALVGLHDHGGMYRWGKEKLVSFEQEDPLLASFKQTCYQNMGTADDFARDGYVVIVPDIFYWGERRLQYDTLPPDWQKKLGGLEYNSQEGLSGYNEMAAQLDFIIGLCFQMYGTTWPGMVIHDDRRCVDLLQSLPEVDGDRIGCFGLSGGGWRTGHLCGSEPRIKASCLVGWMTTYLGILDVMGPHNTFWFYVPGLYQEMDYPDIVSMTVPNALLVIHGLQDPLFPIPAVKEALAKIGDVFKAASAAEKFAYSFYNTPHEFNLEMQKEARAWFGRWLK
jgi:dienelactone hydrolase